jgi:hypothetical protein
MVSFRESYIKMRRSTKGSRPASGIGRARILCERERDGYRVRAIDWEGVTSALTNGAI